MRILFLIPILCLTSCATRPKTYAPPDSAKLKASTQRVSVAVDHAHTHAREAKAKVDQATETAKQVAAETKKLKDVPVTLLQKVNDLESQLDEAGKIEASLEKDLAEADAAKKQVETDKQAYFASAQGLADSATQERDARIKAEKALSSYRWRWWGSWIIFGLGLLACVVLAILKFTGKLML